MSSKSTYRPRRTRIYGANYDIGESYYKKQLADLDNKRAGTSSLTDSYLQPDYGLREKSAPRVSFLNGADDDDLTFRSKSKLRSLLDEDDDEALGSRLKSRFSKLSTADDLDFGDAKKDIFKRSLDAAANEMPHLNNALVLREKALFNDATVRERSMFNDAPLRERSLFNDTSMRGKSLFNEADNEVQGVVASRRIKITTKTHDYQSSDKAEEASSRAKASRARLADLESEMQSITNKQSERETRKTNLRKLLNESDSSSVQALTY